MISLSNLTMHYGQQTLFENVSISFDPGKRYGMVGANGSGKSTLLRLLTGEENPIDGNLSIPRAVQLGVLLQDHFQYENETVINVVIQGKKELWNALQEKEELLNEDTNDEKIGHRLGELEEIIAHYEGYNAESFAAELLSGLGIASEYQFGLMSALSGGFKLRVLLAQVLFQEPDLLLLDEPTNHLDIVSIAWLEYFLKNIFKGTLLVVSHDRNFLNAVCSHIADVDYDTIQIYVGGYDDFIETKALTMEQNLKEIANQEKKVAEMQSFVDRFRAKATKARQAQSRVKQIERIEISAVKRSSRMSPHLQFNPKRPSGKQVLSVKNVSKSFGDNQVLHNVDFTMMRNDKVAIIGPNGIGKSTLLNIILGEHQADEGQYEWGYETHISYFAQDLSKSINSKQNVYDWLYQFAPQETIGTIRGILGQVLFSGDDVKKKISALSGGETARLIFAKMMLEKRNVLVFDEPTNHLDMESIEALESALRNYEGTLLFVSHDRRFVSNIATRILALTPSGVHDFIGSYDEYLEDYDNDFLDREVSHLRVKKSKKKAPKKQLSYEEKKDLKRVVSQLKKKADQLERQIEKQENKVNQIDTQFTAPDFYKNTPQGQIQVLQKEKDDLTKVISEKMGLWETTLTEWEHTKTKLGNAE